MLCLSRDVDQVILIGGNIAVKVLDVKGKTVMLGITAPRDIPVHREEVCRRQQSDTSTGES